MRVDEARKRLAEIITPVTSSEPVALHQALGRILAEDIVSPVDVPPAPNSAVDGYAVFHADLDPEAETRLPVIGRITAGQQIGRASCRVRVCQYVYILVVYVAVKIK